MKSLLEAVAIIMPFFLTPLIAMWVLVSLALVIENIGDLPIDEREPRAAGVCASLSHSCATQTTNLASVR
jgi:hypothetical protein